MQKRYSQCQAYAATIPLEECILKSLLVEY